MLFQFDPDVFLFVEFVFEFVNCLFDYTDRILELEVLLPKDLDFLVKRPIVALQLCCVCLLAVCFYLVRQFVHLELLVLHDAFELMLKVFLFGS